VFALATVYKKRIRVGWRITTRGYRCYKQGYKWLKDINMGTDWYLRVTYDIKMGTG